MAAMDRKPVIIDKALRYPLNCAICWARRILKINGATASIAEFGTEILLPQLLHSADNAGPRKAFLNCENA